MICTFRILLSFGAQYSFTPFPISSAFIKGVDSGRLKAAANDRFDQVLPICFSPRKEARVKGGLQAYQSFGIGSPLALPYLSTSVSSACRAGAIFCYYLNKKRIDYGTPSRASDIYRSTSELVGTFRFYQMHSNTQEMGFASNSKVHLH